VLIWRHRFITGLWGWEMPMGRINPSEAPVQAAAREVEEETGWRPGPLRQLARVQPSSGIMDAAHYLYMADGAAKTGIAVDDFESTRIEWVPLTDVLGLISKQEIISSSTITTLLLCLQAAGCGHGLSDRGDAGVPLRNTWLSIRPCRADRRSAWVLRGVMLNARGCP
jgi:ADP-ribose pyrophosphatase YjhB (NUDIX family)